MGSLTKPSLTKLRQASHSVTPLWSRRAQCVTCKFKKGSGEPKAASPRVKVDLDKLYSQPVSVSRQIGPVKIILDGGKGRSVVTTEVVEPGEVLMVSDPIGSMLSGPVGAELGPEDLLIFLQGLSLDASDSLRLRQLYDGTEASSRKEVSFKTLIEPSRKKKLAAQSKARGFGTGAVDQALTEGATKLREVVGYNSYGSIHADLATTHTRGEGQHSYIGLWPEFSMLNHSCVPNTVAKLVGDQLLLSAPSQLKQGCELSTSYCGHVALAPASVRNKALMDSHGFRCSCPRCAVEAASSAEVQSHMQDMYEAQLKIESVDPGHEDNSNLEVLQAMIEKLEGLVSGYNAQDQQWLRAAVFSCYRSRVVYLRRDRQLEKGSYREALQHLLHLVKVAAPFGDSHMCLAKEVLQDAADEFGVDGQDPRVQTAAQEYLAGLVVRYGRCSNSTYLALVRAWGNVASECGRIDPEVLQQGRGGRIRVGDVSLLEALGASV